VAYKNIKVDVLGDIQFSGNLKPGGVAGTSGQVLTVPSPGALATWGDNLHAHRHSPVTLGSYYAGTNPQYPCVVGAYVWVPNSGDSTVAKFSFSGELIGRYDGRWDATRVATDGTNVWVTCPIASAIVVLSAADGSGLTILSTYCTGVVDLVFGGGYFWVIRSDGYISKFNTSGVFQAEYNLGFASPLSAVYANGHIWVGDDTGRIYKTDGVQILDQFHSGAAGGAGINLAFDGTYIWATTQLAQVYRLLETSGDITTFIPGSGNTVDVATDGYHVWVTDVTNGVVMKMLCSTGALVATYPSRGHAFGIAHDGTRLWVTNTGTTGVGYGTVTCLLANGGDDTGIGPLELQYPTIYNAQAGIAGASGGGQAGAKELKYEANFLAYGVEVNYRLPPAALGRRVIVFPDVTGSSNVNIYPAPGDSIDTLGNNTAFNVTATTTEFWCSGPTTWRSK
jgi:hypothetical protein